MKNTYQIGDKVRLVSKRNPDWPSTGEMDHFLGSEQIIEDVDNDFYPEPRVYFSNEITHEYTWNVKDIECKVTDDNEFVQGETVLVWDVDHERKKEHKFVTKIQFMETETPFVVIDLSGGITAWKYCEKPPVKQIELSIEEIAEKFGVKPEQIKIK